MSPLNVLQKTIAVHDSSGPRVQSEGKKILRNHPSNIFALSNFHLSTLPLLPSLCSTITPMYFFSPFPSFQVPQLFQFHQQPEQSLCKHFVPYFQQNYHTYRIIWTIGIFALQIPNRYLHIKYRISNKY